MERETKKKRPAGCEKEGRMRERSCVTTQMPVFAVQCMQLFMRYASGKEEGVLLIKGHN